MKILVLTNLYPPHTAGLPNLRCPIVVEALRMRGHEIHVLTSTHGLRTEQRDGDVDRRLLLNGAFEHPRLTGVNEMKEIELNNHQALRESLETIEPDVVHVFSLAGLSKSLMFTLERSQRPVVYDVHDPWLASEVSHDPWLRFWNSPSLPLLQHSTRAALELSGERGRLDESAPTRIKKGYERLPQIFGNDAGSTPPNSIGGFRFDHIYFCSQTLKTQAERTGFCVWQGAVIYPGIGSGFVGALRPASAPVRKLLLVAPLSEEGGVMTALEALKIARAAKLNLTLSIYGRGESNYIAKVRTFAVANGLPVEFLNVSNQPSDRPGVYKAHDILLHTPEWEEPFPFTPLEAMGCGLPVIASAAGASGELLRHGENAMTYPPGNVAELAARLQEMLISPALRCLMAETAQAEALAKYNESTVIDQIENFLAAAQLRTE